MFPFKQRKINESTLLREFSKDVDPNELIWHRDRHDRVVEVISGVGWKFQRDNAFPILLREGDVFSISAGQYHRLIKGKTDLRIRIHEKKDQNKDGENDFDDVKIARMKASGMSDAEIRKKHPELFENKKSNHPRQYGAPEGSKRDKQLDASIADMKSDDPEVRARAYRRRERMEKKERSKPGFKNKPRSDTKRESIRMTESELRSVVRSVIEEEVIEEKLSKATKATLKKKAEKRGLTPSSVYAEFRKGLAAWASSGSRKGMSQHQWAHARVNSATPSKPWAVVKKSKAKKKKKRKKK